MQAEVWVIRVDADAIDADRLAADLSEPERQRGRQFRFDHDRRQFIAAHWALQQLLARYTGTPAPLLQAVAAPGRKPAPLPLPGCRWLHHSLSHAGDWVAVALSHVAAVGVDIEPLRDLGELDALVRTAFGAAERRAWDQVERARRREAFFVGWTRKEAWAKATGVGIATADPGAQVSFDLVDPVPLRTAQPATLSSLRWRGNALVSAAALQRDVQFLWRAAALADLAPAAAPH